MKTKLVCLILAASLATAPAPQPKIESFMEGLCFGILIGAVLDTGIVLGVNCWKKHHPGPPPEPPPPAWCYTNTLPTITNSPPWTNHATINASNSVSWYSAADASYEMFDTTVETRTLDQTNWTALYLVRGWKTQSNTVARLSAPDGTPIVTNWTAEHEPFLLTLPAPLPTNSLFRTVSHD
jgi:hypothetical protein